MARKTHRPDDILWTISTDDIDRAHEYSYAQGNDIANQETGVSLHGNNDGRTNGARDSVLLGVLLDTKYPRKAMVKLFEEKLIRVNDHKANPHTEVTAGDEVWIAMAKEKIDHNPVDMNLSILYEDDDLLIVDKPAGVTVNSPNQVSLANGIAHYFKEHSIKRKVRFLNRLDMDTTGCIVIAKSGLAQSLYQQQMDMDVFEKWYTATVEGVIHEAQGSIEVPMRKSEDGIHYEVHKDGNMTRTDFIVRSVDKSVNNHGKTVDNVDNFVDNTHVVVNNSSPFGDNSVHNDDSFNDINMDSSANSAVDTFTTVDIRLWTGKTHQIRVAFSHMGHPLVGDTLYGAKPTGEPFKLRAVKVVFNHIRTGERITVSA